ncbi:MAG: hypothetical protein M1335_05300 [Chloroflexi bacterium]|nr:hypothetical protein [Chloroflexota bacterium]
MRSTIVLLAVLALVAGGTGVGYAASSVYGISGLIETPNDTIAGQGNISLTGNYIANVAKSDANATTFGGVIGIIPNLEVGGVVMDSDASGVKTQGILNAKYRIVAESLDRPSVTVGAVDLTQRLKKFNGKDDEASVFIVIGKNLTSAAEGVSGRVTMPVRGTLGLGTGLYKGGFAALNFAVAPKFDIMVEYLANGIRQSTTVNGGVRYRVIPGLSVEAGAMDFQDFYGGLSYQVSTY